MASKKKLRKRIESLQIELNALRASNNSLHQDLRVVLEGKDKNRILQIRIRTQIEDDFENAAWNGKATRIGNGFFHQIQNCSEYEEMNQAHANKVSDFLSDFKKPEDALHDEKFKYEELEKRTCQPTQVNPEKDTFSEKFISERLPIIEFSPKNQTDGLKKEEEKKEGSVPKVDQ